MSETIVVGYDAEEPAKRALSRAIEEAKAVEGQLLIVAVLAMPLDPYAPPTFGTYADRAPAPDPTVEPDVLKPIVAEAMGRAEAAGVPADYVWAVGEPARFIVDAARDNHASKIVVGSHHHNLFERLLGEDVAAAVKHEANCTVIVAE